MCACVENAVPPRRAARACLRSLRLTTSVPMLLALSSHAARFAARVGARARFRAYTAIAKKVARPRSCRAIVIARPSTQSGQIVAGDDECGVARGLPFEIEHGGDRRIHSPVAGSIVMSVPSWCSSRSRLRSGCDCVRDRAAVIRPEQHGPPGGELVLEVCHACLDRERLEPRVAREVAQHAELDAVVSRRQPMREVVDRTNGVPRHRRPSQVQRDRSRSLLLNDDRRWSSAEPSRHRAASAERASATRVGDGARSRSGRHSATTSRRADERPHRRWITPG